MSRVLFEKAEAGYRNVNGYVVVDIQSKLQASGFDPGVIDGVYGNDTKNALSSWQTNNGLNQNGKVDVDIWMKLMSTNDLPRIQDRALQLTADFEGTGFRKVVGNFDGAGITWGIIGFTLKHGNIKRLIDRVNELQPNLLTAAFGGLKDEFLSVLDSSLAKQLNWANGISIGNQKYKVLPEWEEAFDKLGSYKEVESFQLELVNENCEMAERDMDRFGLNTEIGFALCFDIAVQNGGIDSTEKQQITDLLKQNPPTNEKDKRIIISNVIAENSKKQYIEDVRSRKLTIATGIGTIHGSKYNIQNWGIGEFTI